jgi:parallel beta-helix repeat protein
VSAFFAVSTIGIGTFGITEIPAIAAPIGCGATVTTTITLSRNLRCSGDGLHVAASGVVVDLAGHSILGSATGTGITADSGVTSITIINGTVGGFATGIDTALAGSVDLYYLTIRDAATALRVGDGALVIKGSKISAPVSLYPFTRKLVDVRDSKLTGVRFSLHDRGGTFVRNAFVGGGINAFESDGSVITGNTFTGSPSALSLTLSNRNTITGNRFTGNGVGLDLESSLDRGNVVTDNEFVGNTGVGAIIGDAGSVLDATDISRNTFRDNGAAGLWARPTGPGSSGVPATIANNRFIGNGFSPGAWVDENGAVLNDGAHIQTARGAVAIVSGNIANSNAGSGLDTLGVTDGGGNTARRNGDPGQCVGVVC